MLAHYLIIDWSKFILALVLLLTPGSLFYRKEKIRYREISRDWDDHFWLALAHGLHAIDLLRAGLGTWLLFDSLHNLPDARGFAKYAAVATAGAVRILAVWLQTVVCRHEDSINAPFAFVAGSLFGGVSPLTSCFALALAIPAAKGPRWPIAFFPVIALAHVGIGFWFDGKGALLNLGFGACAAALPWLWAVAFRRELVVAYRAKRHLDGHSSSPLR